MKAFYILLAAAVLAAACRDTEDSEIRLNGRLEAPTVDLGPKVAGRVTEVQVREGDRVKAGQLLVRLDLGETSVAVERDRSALSAAQAHLQDLEVGSRRAEIEVGEAEVEDRRAALELARRDAARQRALLEKKVGSQTDFDQAQNAADRAAAALRMSRERLELLRQGSRRWQTEQARREVGRAGAVLKQSQTVAQEAEIRAPADGVVLHRIAEPGLLLPPGQPALTLAFADRLYVRTFIPETKLGRVRNGQAAKVSVDAFPGRTFPARVTEISPDAEFTPKPVETREERVNLVYAAKVDLDAGWNAPLVPGQPAEVVVESPQGATR
ncbi:MAG TPA: efflux RND transporter periplasmic adaptor subunit [Thermoanaerobaculia bacterium]|jgi:HlyD family secretion protein